MGRRTQGDDHGGGSRCRRLPAGHRQSPSGAVEPRRNRTGASASGLQGSTWQSPGGVTGTHMSDRTPHHNPPRSAAQGESGHIRTAAVDKVLHTVSRHAVVPEGPARKAYADDALAVRPEPVPTSSTSSRPSTTSTACASTSPGATPHPTGPVRATDEIKPPWHRGLTSGTRPCGTLPTLPGAEDPRPGRARCGAKPVRPRAAEAGAGPALEGPRRRCRTVNRGRDIPTRFPPR